MRLLSLLGIVLVAGGVVAPWAEKPMGGSDFHWGLSLAAFLLAGLGAYAWFRRHHDGLAVIGMASVFLCIFFLVHLAFTDTVLWSLLDENAQYANIIRFSRNVPTAQLWVQPPFPKEWNGEGSFSRLGASIYFADWAVGLVLLGGLLVLIEWLRNGRRPVGRRAATGTIILLAWPVLLLLKGFAADFLEGAGDRALTSGEIVTAMSRYKRAGTIDRHRVYSASFHLRLGKAYVGLRQTSNPEGGFYLGERHFQEGRAKEALALYLLAAQGASLPLQEIIQKRIGWFYVQEGTKRYQRNEVGQAIAAWERALSTDPTQVQAVYFLVRAYFDEGRYERSIAAGKYSLARLASPYLKANVYANIGDSYWRLNDFDAARSSYEMSRKLGPSRNPLTFKDLGGT